MNQHYRLPQVVWTESSEQSDRGADGPPLCPGGAGPGRGGGSGPGPSNDGVHVRSGGGRQGHVEEVSAAPPEKRQQCTS